jgi:hypothetical protein
MPYTGTAYSGLGAVLGVDYQNNDGLDSFPYRPALTINVGANANMDQTGDTDRGTWSVTTNYKIGWVDSADWQDYTRTFPAGSFQVWAALSYDDLGGADRLSGKLELVASGVGTTNQTLTELGTFDAPGTGGWGINALVPLKDSSGNIAVVSLGGTQTLRYSPSSGDTDYFMLVPSTAPPPLRFNPPNLSGSTVNISWIGTGTLQEASALTGSPNDWQPVGGVTGNSYSVQISSGAQKFYRLKQP